MPLFNQYQSNKKETKKNKTAPSKKSIEAAKELGMDLGKSWNAYSKEVRIHIYVKDMKEMVRFYNKNGTYHKYNKNYYGNVSMSLRVNSVHKLHDKFSKKNINIGELEDNSWGDTSFEINDIEGNRIIFFSPNISKEKYYKVK